MLRIKPTDDCIIQKLDCTTGDWVDWFSANCAEEDLTPPMRTSVTRTIGEAHGQPADDEPAPSTCVEYDLILTGNNQVILPVHVDENDLITISNSRGQVSENAGVLGTVAAYYPPSGATDIAGSGYPLPGLNKMRLIMSVGGTWYDAYNVIDFTIPSGVAQDNLVFMVNDDSISDNMGTLSFHVKICKAATAAWAQPFDFSSGQHGWVPADNGNGPLSSYSGGAWNSIDDVDHTPETDNGIQITFDPSHIISVESFYHADAGANTGSREVLYQTSGAPVYYGGLDAGAGTFDTNISHDVPDCTVIRLQVDCAALHSTTRITKVIIRGSGTNPFI